MMQENKILKFSLIVSLIIHMAIIGVFSTKRFNIFKSQKPIEVTYQKAQPEKKIPKQADVTMVKDMKINEPKIEEFVKKDKDVLPFDRNLAEFSKFSGKISMDKKEIPKIFDGSKERQISIPMLKSEKMTNPKYVSYNTDLRQRIRQRAYDYAQNATFTEGEVYLSFVLGADGRLKDVHVVESKTKADDLLKNIGLRSIRDASPFQPFPKDLNYPELTFNVIISFMVQ